MTKSSVSASELKTHCARIIDQVAKGRQTIIVTKRGRPVARIVPLAESKRRSLFGLASGCITVHGDIVGPIEVEWEAEQ